MKVFILLLLYFAAVLGIGLASGLHKTNKQDDRDDMY
jgi:hypothetical protein